MKNNKESRQQLCPCTSKKLYKDCCRPYVEQTIDAPTAEALMRSRYTAFCLLDEAYLRYSWHPDTCPKNIHLDNNTRWLGLQIKSTMAGKKDDETGKVEFVARNKNNGKASRLHENSRFCRFDGRWVYFMANMDDKLNE